MLYSIGADGGSIKVTQLVPHGPSVHTNIGGLLFAADATLNSADGLSDFSIALRTDAVCKLDSAICHEAANIGVSSQTMSSEHSANTPALKRVEATGIRADPPAALEDFSYIAPAARRLQKKPRHVDDEEPLIDTTKALTLRSKRTERAQKRQQKKQQKAAGQPSATSISDLPAELIQEIFGYLRPSTLLSLLLVSQGVRDFVLENESAIIRDIIRRRYWVLTRCFPLPVAFEEVDSSAHAALLSHKRQDMLQIHKKPYQHIKGIDPHKICTCMNCVFAWNNLCLILDLSYWQKNLNSREPIPMIARGTQPEWNQKLLDTHAIVVEKAMTSPLTYAVILEKHLRTTVGTILRTVKGKKTIHPRRLYHLTPAEADTDTDQFLERSGPPSFELPWHRDNYYNLEAYVPNRKWSKDNEKWVYYAEGLHERDLQWVKDRFTPACKPDPPKLDQALGGFISDCKKQDDALDEFVASWKQQATL